MDWLVNLAILLVIGSFILGLTGRIKNNERGNVLPQYTTQRSLAQIEKESQEILKRELNHSNVPSFDWIRSNGLSGFMYGYLKFTGNDETLTTTAKANIIKTLSENDLLQGLKLIKMFILVI